MDDSYNNIKDELHSITKALKMRLEYEKGFGITDIKSVTQIEEVTYPEADNQQELHTNKEQLLIELKNKAQKCNQCELYKSRNNLVFGTGNDNANLMFVGEAPGYYEDQKGEPFVGKAGELLTKIIKAIDMEREDVYIANILKCRPPENRNPNANEIISCSPFLTEQIKIISPEVICALGTFAAQTLLNTKESIGRLRGKFHDYNGIKLMATYHPAYLLRNTRDKRKTWEDMQKVRDYLKSPENR